MNPSNTWIVDDTIDVTAICQRNNWHRASAVAELANVLNNKEDAEAFVSFVFCDSASVSDHRPEDNVTDDQYERLTVK